MATRRSIVWVDANGSTRQSLVRGNATLAGVQAALIAVSNADYQSQFEGTEHVNGAPAPISATYQPVGDYVPLVYSTAGGDLVYVTLPSPQAAIFLADQETVNPAAIAAVTAAIVGTVVDAAGNAVVAFVGGVRRARLKEYQ